jgi:hypothetical protein
MQNCKGTDYHKISELDRLRSLASHQKKCQRFVNDVVAGNDLFAETIEPLGSSLMIRIPNDKKRKPYPSVNKYHVQFP